MIDRRTRSLAIHSTIDFALISLSCSRGTSFSKYKIPARRRGETGKTHIFDPFHVVNIPPLIVLPTRTRARSRKQSRFVIILSAHIVAVKIGGGMAPGGSTHATPASMLHAITLSHLGFCRAPRRCGQGLKDFLVIQARVGIRVEKLMFCIVTVKIGRKQARRPKGTRNPYSSTPGPKRSSPSSSSPSASMTSLTASRSSALSPSVSEKGGGGDDGGRDESRRDKGAREGDDELAGRPGDLARLLRRGV